jgi:hypothetical protein
MMIVVKIRSHGAIPSTLFGALGVLTAGAAWLGIAQAPSGGAVMWATFVANSTSAGTLAFSEPGSPTTFARGLIDFKTDASEEHFTVGTHGAIQRGEVVTIDGSIYERFGRPHGAASKEWVRTGSTESLSPFGAGSGGLLDLSGLPVDLKRIGRVDLHGIQTVEYQVSSIGQLPAGRER